LFQKKCHKSKKKCIPIKTTRCVKRKTKGNCHFNHCCKTIVYNGKTVSRSCTKVNRVCPITIKEYCNKKQIKNCVHTRCCKKSTREGKIISKSCYNRQKNVKEYYIVNVQVKN